MLLNMFLRIHCASKLDDVWHIENTWSVVKEKLEGREYNYIE